ncbi:hypothetical protein Lac2_23540 [Claveliimonas bilis]|uniref:Uncharacterized protein n=1 Tax=Claveliimonas bilis TaxID=3028070 RepID=A0ABN6YTU4_9FIRM|nr:hypothetical protein Lac1_01910 [Claveliimonas bilis]BDZ84220.1 hypothetical protein Lac2_23540 [Claveliimonas bilis]
MSKKKKNQQNARNQRRKLLNGFSDFFFRFEYNRIKEGGFCDVRSGIGQADPGHTDRDSSGIRSA